MTTPKHIIQRARELKGDSSASEIREVLVREFPNKHIPTTRAINRWLKDSPAILVEPSVHVEEEQGKIPSSAPENWREHNKKLADVARSLLANDLETVIMNQTESQVVYSLTNQESIFYRLDKDDLSNMLDDNLQSTFDKYKDWFVKYCFIPHLETELSEEIKAKGLWDGIIDENPYELIETLRILAERKTFKGTCPVCKDWA